MNNDKRLLNRIEILSNLDYLIKESVYYRTHSDEFGQYGRIVLGNISEDKIKKKIDETA